MPGPADFTAEELQVLIPLFVSSAREHLETFAGALGELTRDPKNPEKLELLQRSIHSVKGAAFQMGVIHVGALAKAMEAVAKSARQVGRAPEKQEAGLLAESRQMLLGYLSAFERGEEIPEPPADLLGRLDEAVRAVSEPDARKRATGE
jgi:chemotaxis protein histidine kinase CheA